MLYGLELNKHFINSTKYNTWVQSYDPKFPVQTIQRSISDKLLKKNTKWMHKYIQVVNYFW